MFSLSFWIAVLIFLFGIDRAEANLGGFEIQIRSQYGKSIEEITPDPPATFAKKYHSRGLSIIVGYFKGKSCYEIYEKETRESFAESEIEELLKASGKDWKLIEKGTLTKNLLWENKTLVAVYSTQSKTLFLKSKKVLDL